jgi:hypothetical protein
MSGPERGHANACSLWDRVVALPGAPDGIGYNLPRPTQAEGVGHPARPEAHGTGESGGTGRRAGLRTQWGNP